MSSASWKADLERVKSDLVVHKRSTRREVLKFASVAGKESALKMLSQLRAKKMLERNFRNPPKPGTNLAKEAAKASDKLTKTEANYHDKSNRADRKCSACSFLLADGKCSLVAGKTIPEAWCKYFEMAKTVEARKAA